VNTTAQPLQKWLPLVAVAALLVGVYVRFDGLGFAPFAVDEYYLSRSIDSVLRTGIPAFDCGGYYLRGIVLQYLAAGLQFAGLSAELAPRLIGVVCSLLALPAVYQPGKRLHGPVLGLLAIAILALSVWEIEMARFGRMYAPFQAVFVWYTVYFVRYTVDREARALWPMLALSILGPLVWEGGVFLLLTNLLPVFMQRQAGRIPARDWMYLIAGVVLLVLAFEFVTFDFRDIHHDALPDYLQRARSTASADPLMAVGDPLSKLAQHPLWLSATAIPAIVALLSLRWIWTLRSKPLLALGLMFVLLAAAMHQFLLAGAVSLLLLLLGFINWSELFSRQSRYFHLALGLFALFWLAFGATTIDWHSAEVGSIQRGIAMLGYQMLRFPDLIGVVVRPWVRTAPHLGAALLLLLAAALYRMARSDESLTCERALLVLFLVLLLASSASNPPRQETRYVYFLYPLALLLALTVLARLVDRFARRPAAAVGVTSVLALGGFALSEDFQPNHLLHISEPAQTFRTALNHDMQSHLVIREDYRALAAWLTEHVAEGTPVINSVHGLDHYYPGFRYFFVPSGTTDFEDWSCQRGTVERWGNYPLLYSLDALGSVVNAGSTAYLVAFGYDTDGLLRSLSRLHPRIAVSMGGVVIVELRG
jgi:hypothetical protein